VAERKTAGELSHPRGQSSVGDTKKDLQKKGVIEANWDQSRKEEKDALILERGKEHQKKSWNCTRDHGSS